MPTGDSPVPMVAREPELRALQAALSRVEQGETAAVFVIGESGVGKTHLLREAQTRMRERGAVVLSGLSLDIRDAPLYPLGTALRRFLAEAEPDQQAQSAAARELMELIAAGAADSGPAGAWLERICDGFEELTAGEPLVLVLDNLHWIDAATRDLLKHLLAVPVGLRLLVIGAARVEDLHGNQPLRLLLSEWRRQGSVHVIDLPPFDSVRTEQLATALVGRPLTPREAELMWARSSGNAFVVYGLSHNLRRGNVGLADTLREFVLARVDSLPPDSSAAVEAIAVGLEPVGHDLLRGVLGFSDDKLIAALHAARDQRIIEEDQEGYRFHVGLFREALAERLLAPERVGLHSRYVEAIRQRSDGDSVRHQARLAHHLRHAGRLGEAQAAVIEAAKEADRRRRYSEAFQHWKFAVDLTHDISSADLDSVLRSAAEAAHRSGEHECAITYLLRLGESRSTPPCWLHISHARYLAAAGRLTGAEAEYAAALVAPDATDADRAAAAAHSADLLVRLGRYGAAGRRAQEALDLALVTGDSSSAVLARAALGFSQALDDPEAGLATVEKALRAAELSHRADDIVSAYVHLAELLTGPLNELETGVQVAREGAARATELGMGRTYGAAMLATAANGLFRVGRWPEAEKVIAEGFARHPSGREAAELLLARCRVNIGYGDLKAGERDLDAAATLVADAGGARYVVPLLTLRAGLAMWGGNPTAAREAVHEAVERFHDGSDDLVVMVTVVWHGLRAEAEAVATQGLSADEPAMLALRRAMEQITEASAAAARPVRATVNAFLALCAGEISRVESRPDPDAWARAARAWHECHHPYPTAYAWLRFADSLYARNARSARAKEALKDAFDMARTLGAKPLLKEILDLALYARVSLNAEVPNVARAEPPGGQARAAGVLDRLTSREREVLTLVAVGLTNEAIAARLKIAPKTVGVHVTNILKKLQVHSRVQATAIYVRQNG